jgi:hypothetical protein
VVKRTGKPAPEYRLAFERAQFIVRDEFRPARRRLLASRPRLRHRRAIYLLGRFAAYEVGHTLRSGGVSLAAVKASISRSEGIRSSPKASIAFAKTFGRPHHRAGPATRKRRTGGPASRRAAGARSPYGRVPRSPGVARERRTSRHGTVLRRKCIPVTGTPDWTKRRPGCAARLRPGRAPARRRPGREHRLP